jgi:hypothetical protein
MLMEAASASESSVNTYQTTRRSNLEDIHLHARRRENLKCHYRREFSHDSEVSTDILFYM